MATPIRSRAWGARSGAAALLTVSIATSCVALDWTFEGTGTSGSSGGASSSSSTGGSTMCEPGTMDDCYSGPDGTKGVGVCAGGQRTCLPDGTGFGPCAGEVLPGSESCDAPEVDGDCDGKPPTCSGDSLVGKVFPAAGNPNLVTGPSVLAMAIDAGGNVILGGTSGGLDFGGSIGVIGSGGFVAKLDPQGVPLWARTFSSGFVEVLSVAVTPAGNVLVAGDFQAANLVLDGVSLVKSASLANGFLIELDGDTGAAAWGKALTGADAVVNGITTGAGGNIFIAGECSGPVQLDTKQAALGSSVFLADLPPGGANAVWMRGFGGAGNIRSVGVDTQGKIHVHGSLNGTLNFVVQSLSTAGMLDGFFATFDGNGTYLQGSTLGGLKDDNVASMAVTPSGVRWVAGESNGTVDLGSGPMTSAGDYDVFVAKLGADGAKIGGRMFPGALLQGARGIAGTAKVAPGEPAAVMVGAFAGDIDFGGAKLVAKGTSDAFVAALDSARNPLWRRSWSGAGGTAAATVVGLAATGDIWVAGTVKGAIDLGFGPSPNAGYAVFLVKVLP